MDIECESFFGSCAEGIKLGTSVIWKLDALVNWWEMDKGVEDTDPVQTPFQYIVSIYILRNVVSYQSELRRLNAFYGNSDVHN